MSTYFSISASNVTFTESYNYGIVKAGDAGSGARGRDGVGGSDTSNNSSPGNGTSGGNAGTVGGAGTAYIYGETASMTDFNEAVFTGGSDGTPGSRGNDGYGGVNLSLYINTSCPNKDYVYSWGTTWDVVYASPTELDTPALSLKIYCDVYFRDQWDNILRHGQYRDDISSDGNLVGNAGSVWFEVRAHYGSLNSDIYLISPDNGVVIGNIYWRTVKYQKDWTGTLNSVGMTGRHAEKSFYYVGPVGNATIYGLNDDGIFGQINSSN